MSIRSGLWRSFVFSSAGLLAIFAGYVTVLLVGSQNDEEYSVWADYLNQEPHGESHDLPGGDDLTVIRDTTLTLGDFNGHWMDGVRPETLHRFLLANLSTVPIERRLPLESRYELVGSNNADLLTISQKYPDSYGYVAFSRVGFNFAHTQAYFYMEHICGLCGSGRYVLMRKTRSGWRTVTQRYSWVS